MTKEEFKKLYENHTLEQVAELINCSKANVIMIAKELGLSKKRGRPKGYRKIKIEG